MNKESDFNQVQRLCVSCKKWRNFICVRSRHETPENVIFYVKYLTFKLENCYTWYSSNKWY